MKLPLEGCFKVKLGRRFAGSPRDAVSLVCLSQLAQCCAAVLGRTTSVGLFTIERNTAIRQVAFLPRGGSELEEPTNFSDC
jgi:hypothetical protein